MAREPCEISARAGEAYLRRPADGAGPGDALRRGLFTKAALSAAGAGAGEGVYALCTRCGSGLRYARRGAPCADAARAACHWTCCTEEAEDETRPGREGATPAV